MIVVDASCLLEVLLQSSKSPVVEDRLLSDAGPWGAPFLIDVEVTHVLRRYWLAEELTEEEGRNAIADASDFPLLRFPHIDLLPRCWQLRENVTAYDAVYLALAETLDATLVTCDKKLANSSGHQATIELLS